MIKAVIIDLDDTFCLTEAACYEMENEVLSRMGRTAMSRQAHQANWGRPLFDAIIERSPGVDVAAFRKAYIPVIAEFTASGKLDNAPEANYQALEALQSIGKELFVLTSRTHEELEHLMAPHHRLAQYITATAFYYKDNMEFHKPDPRAFEVIERNHGFLPAECVYIGDSVSDAVAAKGAGLHFVASLESGLRLPGDFADYPVDAFINSFPSIVEVVHAIDEAA